MSSGLDRLGSGVDASVRNRRVALICNQTTVDSRGRHAVQVLAQVPGAQVTMLLGPEHGIWSTHQDMETLDASQVRRDPVFDLPVMSLYGDGVETLRPDPALFSDVDAIVFDVQDIGTRYYTYAATLALTMEAAQDAGVPVVVLDRPNPIGSSVEGPLLRKGFESFVGLEPGLPIRHGMTMGELGRWYGDRRAPQCELIIIDHVPGGPARWVPTSPNMPTVDTAVVYPGMCLLEGTTLSEGRGTTSPFLIFGAPGIDPLALADELRTYDFPGVDFVPRIFRPEFQKHAGEACAGVFIRVLDAQAIHAVELGVVVLAALKKVAPDVFKWRTDAYEFVTDVPAIDLLWGSGELRECIDSEGDIGALLASARREADAFKP
jgi:uncharacterized protein YbbC (DUF1343 family)